jgi:hypothetical protein
VEVKTSRTVVEVNELTRTGRVVRSARFMAPRVLAVVEHPVEETVKASPVERLGKAARLA